MAHQRVQRLTTDQQRRRRAAWLVHVVGVMALAGAVSGVLLGFSITWLRVFSTILPILIVLALLAIHHVQKGETTAILQQLDTCIRLVKEQRAGRIAQAPSTPDALARPLDLPPYVASAPDQHIQTNN